MLITLLLFALQVAADLSTASAVSAAGYDAARRVASYSVDHHDAVAVARAEVAAEVVLRRAVSGLGTIDQLSWELEGGHVHLHVTVLVRRVAPRAMRAALGLDRIERDLVVTVEEPA